MNEYRSDGLDEDGDFRRRTTQWVGVAGIVFIAPFSIAAFLGGRPQTGILAIVIVTMLALGAWLGRRGRHDSGWLALTMTPTIILGIGHVMFRHGTIGLLWVYPAVLACYCVLPERHARLANAAILAILLPIALHVLEPAIAVRAVVTLGAVSVFAAILVNAIGRQQARLHHKVVTDPLTGLLNRHALEPALENAVAQARADGTPMTALTLDLDHFKRVNDAYGHAVGDDVLCAFGRLLREGSRAGDSVFRLGGEEFLVLLRGTGSDDAARLADKLRRVVADAPLLVGHPLTTSVGFAVLGAREGRDSWLARADAALYRAKAGGRNRVVGGNRADA